MNIYESFSHSLVTSKLWLCEQLEQTIVEENIKNPIVNILAGWDNLLGFMLAIRKPKLYGSIHNYDMNSEHVNMANKLCDNWIYEYPKIYNTVQDINTLQFTFDKKQLFINCSVDQIDGVEWYNIIPPGSLVCLQCTDLPVWHKEWDIKQGYSMQDFSKTYQLSTIKYCSSKSFDYEHLSFTRHMIIGIK
jgi:hypothetical protein